ncbi:ABC transporter permease [Undibacterium arcticum]|uniref:ABC transporter permease n=1 Tax=Undibacterium arcticum TaxID=1762892 RepID=A0ABV7F407_9BURK
MILDYVLTVVAAGWVTLQVALVALFFAIALGLLGAVCKMSTHPFLMQAAEAYTSVIRGIPDLVMMLLIFYGAPAVVNYLIELAGGDGSFDLNPFLAGTLTLGIIFGAYLTETFRGAILGIPKGQAEAGLAFGMSNTRVYLRIILPQMVRLAIPGFTNNWLVLVKCTALVSIIGLEDIMFKARGASEATRQPFTFYLVTALVYLAITTVSMLMLRWLEKKYSMGFKPANFS